jgi:hypothetical protein
MFTCALVCVHKKVSEIDDQNRLFGLVHTHQCYCRLTHTETYIGLGRMSNISVSALGPDSRLCQHIYDVNSWYSCLLVLFYTLFPYIYLSLTDGPNFTPFQNVEFVNKSKPFFQTNSREEKNTKFQHNLTPERQFC